MRLRPVLLALVTLFVVASAVKAQPRGGPPGDFQGGPRGLRGGPPGADRSQFLDNLMRQLDRNGDGVITPDEVDPRIRPMYERMATQAGLDPTKPVRVQDLRDAMQNRGPRGGGPGGGPGGPPAVVASGTKPGPTPPSPVPGFGVPAQPASVAAFGPSAAAGPSPAPASCNSNGSQAWGDFSFALILCLQRFILHADQWEEIV